MYAAYHSHCDVKRFFGNIAEIAVKLNAPSTSGLSILPIGGTIITELEAIKLISGASAELIAAQEAF